MILGKESENGVTIAFYESSNILQSVYIENKQLLFIVFHKGGTYSYDSVSREVYEQFETCESQGKFLISSIKGKFQFKKDFILKEWELKSVKERIDEMRVKNKWIDSGILDGLKAPDDPIKFNLFKSDEIQKIDE
jgi:hypothetical protein